MNGSATWSATIIAPIGIVRRRQALGGRDDVRDVAVALAAEDVPEAAPRADDLVGDQQHAVAVADLAHALRSSRRAATKQPPAFWTGSRITAATVSGPSARIRSSIASAAHSGSQPSAQR